MESTPCIELDCYARGREAEHLRGRTENLKHLWSRSLSEWQHRRSQFCIEIQLARVFSRIKRIQINRTRTQLFESVSCGI